MWRLFSILVLAGSPAHAVNMDRTTFESRITQGCLRIVAANPIMVHDLTILRTPLSSYCGCYAKKFTEALTDQQLATMVAGGAEPGGMSATVLEICSRVLSQ